MRIDKLYPEELMEKYYRAETSLEEENLLQQYALGTAENVPEEIRAQFGYFKIKNEEESSFTDNTIDQLLATKKRKKVNNFKVLLRIAASLAVVFSGVVWWLLLHENVLSTRKAVTAFGEQTRITLPDSTVVWLNELSEVRYDNSFNHEKRMVWLQGEAFFEVKHNSQKPFIIQTGIVTTEVTGTSFNLRNYSLEQMVELDVLTGKVQFGATKKIEIHPGTMASFNTVRRRVDIIASRANVCAWRTKRLVFDDASIKDVKQDLERYFHINIKTEDPSLLTCHFTGRFDNPEVEDVLNVISYSLNIQYSLQQNKYILSGVGCITK